jgi:predicted transcriptional regulator
MSNVRPQPHPLKEQRLKAGLSLGTLADSVSTSKATLSRIENWKQEPTLTLIAKIKKKLGGDLSADDFIRAGKRR